MLEGGQTQERETEVCYLVNSYYAEYSRGLLYGRMGRQYKYDNMQNILSKKISKRLKWDNVFENIEKH